jgi:hypothetical protein
VVPRTGDQRLLVDQGLQMLERNLRGRRDEVE